jgi:pimeloyl-ACP methyl ester carboxylesterase
MDELSAGGMTPQIGLVAPRDACFAQQRKDAAGDRLRPPNSVLNALAVLVGMDLSAQLGAVRTPALILHPDKSPFILVAVAAKVHAELPDSELHVIGHAKHGMPSSHGRQCAAILHGFLDRGFAGWAALRNATP